MTRPTFRTPPTPSGCYTEFREESSGAVSIVEVEPCKTEIYGNEWSVYLTAENVAMFIKWWNEGVA